MFSRPTLTELVSRTLSDVVSRLPDANILRRSNASVYARVLAGLSHGLHGYIDWLSKQIIYDTAEDGYLERWASIWGISRALPSLATGTVNIFGLDGLIVPYGTLLTAWDGVEYETTLAGTIDFGMVTVPAMSISSGNNANRPAGHIFTLQSPGAFNPNATGGEFTGGADVETDDSLRSRLLTRIKAPPQGGDAADYIAWAMSVPNVTRAWVYPLELGAGTVTIRFMMDSLYVSGIPLSGDVTAVAAAISPLRPVTANVTVLAPIAVPIDFTVSGLIPSNITIQNAIVDELKDLIVRESSPGGTILLSHIRESISRAAGEFDHVLTVPSANVVSTTGNISTYGSITFI